jgi:hypothetical protein
MGPSSVLDAVEKRETSCPYLDSNSDPLVVQPVMCRYIDCAIPAPQAGCIIDEFILRAEEKH